MSFIRRYLPAILGSTVDYTVIEFQIDADAGDAINVSTSAGTGLNPVVSLVWGTGEVHLTSSSSYTFSSAGTYTIQIVAQPDFAGVTQAVVSATAGVDASTLDLSQLSDLQKVVITAGDGDSGYTWSGTTQQGWLPNNAPVVDARSAGDARFGHQQPVDVASLPEETKRLEKSALNSGYAGTPGGLPSDAEYVNLDNNRGTMPEAFGGDTRNTGLGTGGNLKVLKSRFSDGIIWHTNQLQSETNLEEILVAPGHIRGLVQDQINASDPRFLEVMDGITGSLLSADLTVSPPLRAETLRCNRRGVLDKGIDDAAYITNCVSYEHPHEYNYDAADENLWSSTKATGDGSDFPFYTGTTNAGDVSSQIDAFYAKREQLAQGLSVNLDESVLDKADSPDGQKGSAMGENTNVISTVTQGAAEKVLGFGTRAYAVVTVDANAGYIEVDPPSDVSDAFPAAVEWDRSNGRRFRLYSEDGYTLVDTDGAGVDDKVELAGSADVDGGGTDDLWEVDGSVTWDANGNGYLRIPIANVTGGATVSDITTSMYLRDALTDFLASFTHNIFYDSIASNE